MKTSISIAAGSFLVTAALIKVAPALAEPAPAQNVSIVQTADLDLSTKAGRAKLDHRLVIAAYEVCGEAADVDLAGQNAVDQCRADVLANARARGDQLANRGGGTILIAANR
jgi:UrcA family protein